MHTKLFILILLLQLMACTEYEKQYHKNGNLKLEVQLIDGIRNGKMQEYDESGNLLAQSKWKDNLMHGLALHYYPNGDLKESANWLDGKKDGEVKSYYNDGQMKFIGTYKLGKSVGDHVFYYASGKVMERQIYDSNGELETYFKYDASGNPRLNASRPIYTYSEDTVILGSKITIGLKLGNPISEDVQAYIGLPFEDPNRLGLRDTIETLYSDIYWKYEYRFQPNKVGMDSLRGFLVNILETDSQTYYLQHAFSFKYFVLAKGM